MIGFGQFHRSGQKKNRNEEGSHTKTLVHPEIGTIGTDAPGIIGKAFGCVCLDKSLIFCSCKDIGRKRQEHQQADHQQEASDYKVNRFRTVGLVVVTHRLFAFLFGGCFSARFCLVSQFGYSYGCIFCRHVKRGLKRNFRKINLKSYILIYFRVNFVTFVT